MGVRPSVAEAYKLGADRCIIKSWTAPHNLAKVVSDTLNNKTKQKDSFEPKKEAKSKAK